MNRRFIQLFVLCSAAGLAGCAQRPTVAINTPITAAELAPYKRPGKATVTGRAILRRQGARTVSCAGQQVLLTPAVAFNRQTVAAMRAGQKPVAGSQVGSSEAYWRRARCDARGRFFFRNVPPAAWYVSVALRWPDPPHEGALVKEVRVPRAGTVRVLLTERDTVR